MELAKRDSILEAAARLFARLGFKKASVDEIARNAGVAKGTIYLCCRSKEDLFYQAVHRELRNWLAEVSRMIDPRVAADELLVQVSNAGIEYLQKHPLVRDLFLGIYSGQLPGWASRFEELRELGHQNVVELLKLGIRQGRFREELDVEETARILQDMTLAGYLFQSRDGADEGELVRRQQAGLNLVLHGLLVPQS